MNPNARVLEKQFDLSAISLFTKDDHEYLSCLPQDGRANRLAYEENQRGGLCSFACGAARFIAPRARLALCSTVGEADRGEVHDALDPLCLQRIELIAVPNKRTNRSRVSMTPSGERQIVRLEGDRAVNFDEDLDERGYRRLRAVVSQSKAVVLGHLPSDLTAGLIDWARHVGSLTVLCPGTAQFAGLHALRPDVGILNFDEAKAATDSSSHSAKTVFARLNQHLRAEQAVIMTMGPGLVFVADRLAGSEWILPPLPAPVAVNGRYVFPVGCGDVLAGVVGLVLGQPRRLVQGELLRDPVALGQAAATAHFNRDADARDLLRAKYNRIVVRMSTARQIQPARKKAA